MLMAVMVLVGMVMVPSLFRVAGGGVIHGYSHAYHHFTTAAMITMVANIHQHMATVLE